MSDMWEKDPKETEDTLEEIETVNESDSAQTEEPVSEPQVEAAPAPQQPVIPPTTGVAPDGSYRYVPPYNGQVPPAYRPPQYYHPATPQPPVAPTPPPAPKQKKERGWIVIVAILAALAVLISGMTLAFWWIDNVSGGADKSGTTTTNGATVTTTQPSSNGSAPDQLQQNPPPVTVDPDTAEDAYCDGGYTTEYIVNKNLNSTVVLEMYMETSNRYFGESGLQQVGVASGIVWTADGYIITNCHCVVDEDTNKAYDRINVILYDGTVYEDAQVIGADDSTDLAVIKVNATDLVPAEFGDSDALAVGARVVTLGNAAGLSWTATQGIVSAKARDVYDDTGYAIKCLQVDAAINGGNSGGPLLNKFGQVVGINSAKIVADGIEGLGFSIPINEAKEVLESLAKYGYVKGRVSLGIEGVTYDDGMYQGFAIVSIPDASGWKNTDTEQWEYSEDRMGRILRLTLIVGVDDVDVVDYGTLRAELAKHKVGDTVTLTLMHYNRESNEVANYTVEVVLQEQTAN